MKYIDEYRQQELADGLAKEIRRTVTRPWVLMEVCGGQTHSIVKYGIDYLLPKEVELVHGPGCPVCVTPLEMIDKAQAIARRPDVIFCSFGDMLRVPGSESDLLILKSRGADVRVVYSPHGLPEDRPGQPGQEGGLLCHRVRDDGARQRHVGLAGAAAGIAELLDPGLARAGAAGDGGHPAIAARTACRAFLGPGHVCTVVGLPRV